MSEKGPEADNARCRFNVAEVPTAEVSRAHGGARSTWNPCTEKVLPQRRWKADISTHFESGDHKMQTIQRVVSVALIAFAAIALVAPRAEASAAKINADVRASLDQFFRQTPGARELANNAAGVLVFPTVVKAGLGIGGEYGEGALLVGGRPVGYYNLVSASFGFQLGAQARTIIIMFMTPSALAGFNRTAGWKVGVDGSVTLITLGAGASIDTNQITSPVIGFVLDPTGLMYNLTLEGSKISRINP
jgi:lipid-binding SYLF domain-containing protein